MSVSRKCQYALRGVFELAKRYGTGPTSVSEIAAAQEIPVRFLELILRELKQAGLLDSQRGPRGGYVLAADPRALTVGEVVRFIDGPLGPVDCVAEGEGAACGLQGRCAFLGLWRRVRDAVADVYDSTTFQDLIDEEAALREAYVPSYTI